MNVADSPNGSMKTRILMIDRYWAKTTYTPPGVKGHDFGPLKYTGTDFFFTIIYFFFSPYFGAVANDVRNDANYCRTNEWGKSNSMGAYNLNRQFSEGSPNMEKGMKQSI